MLRSARLHRHTLRLAFVALALMVCVPFVSRLVAAAAPRTASVLVEMCTLAGLKLVDLGSRAKSIAPSSPAQPDSSLPTHPQGHPADADCAYCPMLASVALLFGLLVLLFEPPPARHGPRHVARALRLATRHPCGLGSRGPPQSS